MKATKTNRKAKVEIRKELVSTFVEEWTEFRVYRGKERIASFKTEKQAADFVKAA